MMTFSLIPVVHSEMLGEYENLVSMSWDLLLPAYDATICIGKE